MAFSFIFAALTTSFNLAAVNRKVTVNTDDSFHLKVVYDADQTSQLPCVVFLSGADCPHESYAWLAERLALAGCAVALSTCVVPFGPTTCTLSVPFDLAALSSLDTYKEIPSRAGLSALVAELETLASSDGPLSGKLDTTRLAIGGHSSGGRTALDLAAFDQPFDHLKCVFTYGASLVNSMASSGFAAPGSVIPCDAASPPPLLLLGGSKDGVSAALSASKEDGTETLRRTVEEGVSKGNGLAELCIVKGANHMVFCDPIDPSCGALRSDMPMAPEADADGVRKLLGSLIVDFLAANEVLEEGVPEAERTATVDPAMLHTLDASQSPPSSRSASVAYALELRGAGGASGEEDEEAGSSGDDQDAWATLSSALDGKLAELESALRLTPSDYAEEAAEWTAGGLVGSVKGWTSPFASWAVRYANKADDGNAESVGLNVWLAPRLPVPHLTLYVGVRNGRATFMADHLPRFDMGSEPSHVESFYKGEQSSKWSALQRGENGIKSFRSGDPSVRALQGPNALALTGAADDPIVVKALVDEVNRHVDTWLDWVRTTPLLDESSVPEVEERDRRLRCALRDHEREAGERFMGAEIATRLSGAMAGPNLIDGASLSRAEPIGWRPPTSDSSLPSLEDEIIRFGKAAQREVAGLEEGDGSKLHVKVTVHHDFGSFMASKPSLTIEDEEVTIGMHAFLEPEWSSFERPLAQAAGGVYTYKHEEERIPGVRTSTGQLLTSSDEVEAAASMCKPTLCLKMKRREAVNCALSGTSLSELAEREGDQPDPSAARRVNELACKWANAEISIADDRELQDAPDGPFGNKGGLYIESRIQIVEGKDGVTVTSPTITTPLDGVPPPFLAGHYMKVLCPFAS